MNRILQEWLQLYAGDLNNSGNTKVYRNLPLTVMKLASLVGIVP